jgi:hypothetical protein
VTLRTGSSQYGRSSLGEDKQRKGVYADWFDAECEQVTHPKIVANKRVHQRNYTRNAVEEYCTAKREEKRVNKNKKGKYTEDKSKKN